MKTDKQIGFERTVLTNVYMVEGGRLKASVAVENIIDALTDCEGEKPKDVSKPELPDEIGIPFKVAWDKSKDELNIAILAEIQDFLIDRINSIIKYLKARE